MKENQLDGRLNPPKDDSIRMARSGYPAKLSLFLEEQPSVESRRATQAPGFQLDGFVKSRREVAPAKQP